MIEKEKKYFKRVWDKNLKYRSEIQSYIKTEKNRNKQDLTKCRIPEQRDRDKQDQYTAFPGLAWHN